jgi:hypothetical protein
MCAKPERKSEESRTPEQVRYGETQARIDTLEFKREDGAIDGEGYYDLL